MKSVTGTGVPSGTSTVTSRNHLPSFLSTRSDWLFRNVIPSAW